MERIRMGMAGAREKVAILTAVYAAILAGALAVLGAVAYGAVAGMPSALALAATGGATAATAGLVLRAVSILHRRWDETVRTAVEAIDKLIWEQGEDDDDEEAAD